MSQFAASLGRAGRAAAGARRGLDALVPSSRCPVRRWFFMRLDFVVSCIAPRISENAGRHRICTVIGSGSGSLESCWKETAWGSV